MALPPVPVKLDLTLDFRARRDAKLVASILEAFPPEIGPSVSEHILLSQPALGAAGYVVLTIIAGGGMGWAARKILGPTLDAVGCRLRDAVMRYGKKAPAPPPGVGMHFMFEGVEFEVSIESTCLLEWRDADGHFKQLGEYVENEISVIAAKDSAKVRLRWEPDEGQWVFLDIWTRDMARTRIYYVFNRLTGEWEQKTL